MHAQQTIPDSTPVNPKFMANAMAAIRLECLTFSQSQDLWESIIKNWLGTKGWNQCYQKYRATMTGGPAIPSIICVLMTNSIFLFFHGDGDC